MKNNWQVLAMYRNLNDVLERAVGGEILLPEQLSKMTALELMELLAPNDVRFCVQEKPKEQRELPREMGLGSCNLGHELSISHEPHCARYLLYGKQAQLGINYYEMTRLVAFVKDEK